MHYKIFMEDVIPLYVLKKYFYKDLKLKTMEQKTLKLILAATLLAFVVYIACYPPVSQSETEEPIGQPPTEQPPTEGPTAEAPVCLDYKNEDMSTLDADLVHQMTEDYRANQWAFINPRLNTQTKKDAYSIWFDLETLKKFLYHIEKITTNHDSSIKKEDLGVRIYYAAYPDTLQMKKYPDLDSTVRDPDLATYGSLHTLVMIPTISTKTGKMLDFNPLDTITYKDGLAKVEKYTKNHSASIPNNTAALSGSSAPSRRTGSKNHGLLYPPTGGSTALGF